MDDLNWQSLGDQQEVAASRWEHAEEQFKAAYEYAVKAQTHLWIVALSHRASDATLDSFDGTSDQVPILDAETLTSRPMAGCYICEQNYEPRLRLRRCPGEPRRPQRG